MAETALERLKRMKQEQAGTAAPAGSALARLKQMKAQEAPAEEPERKQGKLRSLATAVTSGAVPLFEATMGGAAAAAELLTTRDLERAKRMYQSARQDVAREQEAAKKSLGTLPYEAVKIGSEIASLSKAPLAIGKMGARVLGQTAPTAVRGVGMAKSMGQRALEFGGVEAARGVSRAGIQQEEAPTLAETIRSGGLGFLGGTAGAFGGEAAIGLARAVPGVGRVIGGGGRLLDEGVAFAQRQGRRATDALRGTRMQQLTAGSPRLQQALARAADIIEPSDITRIRREVAQELPVTGQVAEEFVETGRRASSAATAAQREANRRASEEAAGGVAAAQNEFKQMLTNLRERAAQVIGGRPRPGMGGPTGEQLQQTIRAEQLARGKEGYALANQLGATPDPEVAIPAIVESIRGNALMRRLYREAQQETASRGGGVVAQVGSGDKARKFRVVDLEGFDKMRQQVRDRVMSIADKDIVGSRRTMMRDLYERIDKMEAGFLASLPKEAGDALRVVRSDYSRYFRELDALRDGANLAFFGVGKKVGKIQQAPMSITQLEQRVKDYTPRQMAAFRAGASEWLDSVIQKSPDDALKIAKRLVGTPEGLRRTRLAMGDDFAGALGEVVQQASTLTRPSVGRRVAAEVPQMGQARAAVELGRQMRAAQGAVRGEDAAAAFLRAFRPQMGAGAQQQARQVMASEIDRMLAGKSPREAIAMLEQMPLNPAVKAMLKTEMERAIQRVGTGLPVRRRAISALGAQFGGAMGREER